MERTKVKFSKPVVQVANIGEPVVNSGKNVMGTIAKWVPLICAGTAIGVSVLALKEIKNTRKELYALKKEKITGGTNEVLEKKMEALEQQLNKITEFLKNQNNKPPTQPVKPVITKNVIPPKVPEEVKIINSPVAAKKNDPVEQESDVEYEEVEVTDSESED
jgi:hypothetical protein